MKVRFRRSASGVLVLCALLHGISGARLGSRRAAASTSRRRHLTEVAVEGDDGKPASAFPLAKCQGDCDDHGKNECSMVDVHGNRQCVDIANN